MLKKNQPVKFTRPISTMRQVLLAIEQGIKYRHDIVEETKLRLGQVDSAIYNLKYIGVIEYGTDDNGRRVYLIPGTNYGVAKCLCGVRSIFDVR